MESQVSRQGRLADLKRLAQKHCGRLDVTMGTNSDTLHFWKHRVLLSKQSGDEKMTVRPAANRYPHLAFDSGDWEDIVIHVHDRTYWGGATSLAKAYEQVSGKQATVVRHF